MYDKLLKIVEENNFQIDDETEIEIERLIEFLKAKNKNDKIEDIIKWFDNKKSAHQGKKPIFAEYFEDSGKGKIFTSVISVEDVGRFYLKTNKIMIVEIDEELNIPENFIWLNLYQIKKLIKKDLIINSLARSIFGS